MENKISIDQTLFNEKSLYLLNIRELRILGRKFGVPSPTTKNKKELVDYILNIVYGKIEIPIRNPYGRHPNTYQFDMGHFVDRVKTNTDISNDYFEYTQNEEFKPLKVSSPTSEYILDEMIETRIYCSENNHHYLRKMAFVKSENDIEISSELVNKFKLENSDVVEVFILGDLIRVMSINAIRCLDNFSGISVLGQNINSGLKQEIFLNSNEEINLEIENLLQNLEKYDVKPVIFTKNCYKNKNLQCINYTEDEDKSQIYKKLVNFSNICENNIRLGENIIVIIDNYNYIKEVIYSFEIDFARKIENYLESCFDKITKLGNVILLFNEEIELKY